MPFYDDVRAEVLQHGAIHNSFLTRFQASHIGDEEFDGLPSSSTASRGVSAHRASPTGRRR